MCTTSMSLSEINRQLDGPMCTTSMSLSEINRQLDGPSEHYNTSSPSSISEMDLRQLEQHELDNEQRCDESNFQTNKPRVKSASSECACEPRPVAVASAGDDTLLAPVDGRSDNAAAAILGCINQDLAPSLTTSLTPRKRRLSDTIDAKSDANTTPNKRVQLGDRGQETVASPATQDEQAHSCRDSSFDGPPSTEQTTDGAAGDAGAGEYYRYDDDDGYHSPSPSLDSECSAKPFSRRTLYIEYWTRTDECKERKWDHLDDIAENYGSAEEHIYATTLQGRTACLEPNMFPYDTPAGIEHWTLWHVNDLNHDQVKQYVENWIDANAPHVQQWNYDDNPERSIDIFHVHVYLQVGGEDSVLQGRKVEDLVHE